jgi:hypothetical protein
LIATCRKRQCSSDFPRLFSVIRCCSPPRHKRSSGFSREAGSNGFHRPAATKCNSLSLSANTQRTQRLIICLLLPRYEKKCNDGWYCNVWTNLHWPVIPRPWLVATRYCFFIPVLPLAALRFRNHQ